METHTASYFIKHLALQPHPEGGWFKETYRSEELAGAAHLPERFTGARNFSTGIYFLLGGKEFSAFHRIKSDEMWHFYYGGPLHVYVISPVGELELIRLGARAEEGEVFQAVVKAGSWFASRPASEDSFSLVGCTVSPGFHFDDFEMAKREALLAQYPQHRAIIESLTAAA